MSSVHFRCLYLYEPLRAKFVTCVGSYVRCHGERSAFCVVLFCCMRKLCEIDEECYAVELCEPFEN